MLVLDAFKRPQRHDLSQIDKLKRNLFNLVLERIRAPGEVLRRQLNVNEKFTIS